MPAVLAFLLTVGAFCAYSGKVRLIRARRDCKQRSWTASKKTSTVSQKASDNSQQYWGYLWIIRSLRIVLGTPTSWEALNVHFANFHFVFTSGGFPSLGGGGGVRTRVVFSGDFPGRAFCHWPRTKGTRGSFQRNERGKKSKWPCQKWSLVACLRGRFPFTLPMAKTTTITMCFSLWFLLPFSCWLPRKMWLLVSGKVGLVFWFQFCRKRRGWGIFPWRR